MTNAITLNQATVDARVKQAAIPALPTAVKPGHNSDAYVEVSKFQRALFGTLFSAADKLCKAIETSKATCERAITAQYGNTCPTFEQFKSDRSALRVLSLERGLVDDQYVRKSYNAAIIKLYGALPVSMSEAAIAKRATRPTSNNPVSVGQDAKKSKAPATPAKRADDSEIATIGQFIAKFGHAAVLVEMAKILATETSTALDAKTLIAVAGHISKAA
jgi:hypothetical protein